MYLYLKALHIIFIVTWFSGMFYIVRLFIYVREAQDHAEQEVLTTQLNLMAKRLWLGITWPSAILTLILGPLLMWQGGWLDHFSQHHWLHVKLLFVLLLYAYFFSLHRIYLRQQARQFRLSSNRLRLWNEVATVFLVAIVMVAVVKSALSWFWGLVGLAGFFLILVLAIRIYRKRRLQSLDQ